MPADMVQCTTVRSSDVWIIIAIITSTIAVMAIVGIVVATRLISRILI
jgi:hypothetical protein